MEYDRIRNLLYSKTIQGNNKQFFENRIQELERLGAKAIDFIN